MKDIKIKLTGTPNLGAKNKQTREYTIKVQERPDGYGQGTIQIWDEEGQRKTCQA